MGKSLVIVESPAKIKSLQKFLGPDYRFESSYGHIRDLPKKGMGIDMEHNFEPQYEILEDKQQVVSNLIKAAKQCDTVYLCPDPDREGEAIAWHLASIFPEKTTIKRASFHSITKDAVVKALSNPRNIDLALVNAQQARRLLDRLVGYTISPILARRIRRSSSEGSISAGRVQSIALKLVVDREKEIEAFKSIEYWNIAALLETGKEKEPVFKATVHTVDGKRVEKELQDGKDTLTTIPDQKTAESIVARLKKAKYKVGRVDKKEERRYSKPPFITSTLQQEASRQCGFSVSNTMRIAQGLYEGIDMGNEGTEGLITYMRTDSVRSAPEAISEARTLIAKQYGAPFLPAEANVFKTKNAQDAHEAIRPTNLKHPPEVVEPFLNREQNMLYGLIWRRFVASQMAPAVYDTVSADIATDQSIMLRATGSTIKFKGFLAVYEEQEDDKEKEEESKIPASLAEGNPLDLKKLTHEQSFTRPPPRYSEASLVKELEKRGIGRPSTYAAIMNKIQSRDYTVKEQGRLKPTGLGRVVAEMLETSFQLVMNIDFTKQMEDDLEQVAENQKDWKAVIIDFWAKFSPSVEEAIKSAIVPKIPTDIDCPKCGAEHGSKLQKTWAISSAKYFYSCSRYPDCDHSSSLEHATFDKGDYGEGFNWEQPCPLCGQKMSVRHGPYGAFMGCETYPNCKGLVKIPAKGEVIIPFEDLPHCVAIGCDGRLSAKTSFRYGKKSTFYSCTTYPHCDIIGNSVEQIHSKYGESHAKAPYIKKVKKGQEKPAAKTKAGAKTKTGASKAKAPKKAAASNAPKKPRAQAPIQLSPTLAAFVGVGAMSRPDVVKNLWVYIKANNCQSPTDKRMILPDGPLAKIFGTTEPVSMFHVAKLITPHFMGKVD